MEALKASLKGKGPQASASPAKRVEGKVVAKPAALKRKAAAR